MNTKIKDEVKYDNEGRKTKEEGKYADERRN